MQWPSFTVIVTEIFLAYIVYWIYNMSLLFVAPPCEEGETCFTSLLSQKPELQLHVYTYVDEHLRQDRQLDSILVVDDFNYTQPHNFPLTLTLPHKTRNNGTLFFLIVVAPILKKNERNIVDQHKDSHVSYIVVKLTQYVVPKAEAFNLLKEKNSGPKRKKESSMSPVTHIKSRVTFTIMTDDVKVPLKNMPMELVDHLNTIDGRVYLPIVNHDFLQTRRHDLVRIRPQNSTVNVILHYSPITIGKLRLLLQVEAALQRLKDFGFSDEEMDEMKGIFTDTNMYVLAATFFIAAIHMLFDFLAFKNDVSYWRRKDNLVGLSKWTVVWTGFSQTVIFLYLLDEGSSLFVIIPTGIGSIIELLLSIAPLGSFGTQLRQALLRSVRDFSTMFFSTTPGTQTMWKLKKVLKLRLRKGNNSAAEVKTREFDAESMRYLSYLLYPLVIGGAIYSLLYQPHKSWYSWSINSLVNGVYAFGFLFMLPQLFMNYKLKSVVHAPWRTFMYRAFNTFIDDVFAFIISTPTSHKIACFRDDVVFIVYLYQRWLYPVDKSRLDVDSIGETPIDFAKSNKKTD